MSEPRLKSGIWVQAHARRCMIEGAAATVARRGDEDAGDILLKLNNLSGGFQVLARAFRGDGKRIWMRATGKDWTPEADADAAIARRIARDPDLWVLEIEDRQGRHFLGDPVE